MNLPSIQHHQPNFTQVNLGRVKLWFSYQTLIAFQVQGGHGAAKRMGPHHRKTLERG